MHYLVVPKDVDPEDALGIEHPKDCPIEVSGTGEYSFSTHLCAFNGDMPLDEYFDIGELEPGKYQVEAWSEKTWTDYGWEWDGGLRFADKEIT